MDFKDNILQLAERIEKQKDAIQTEEATKNAFIMPMIAALGYDIFNPFEVAPEMDCDLTKRGDKIDYAIKKEDKTILLIECKHCKQNLNLHNTQLSKYYAASNARFGVLTNGIEYRFYADLDKANIMDEKPFLIVDMLDLSEVDIDQMKKFHKSYYNESEILDTAQELQITIQIKDILTRIFQSPGDEFTRYFVRSLNNGKSTPKLIEQYKPIIKKSIAAIVNDTISDRLNMAIKNGGQQQDDEQPCDSVQEENSQDKLLDGVIYMDKERGTVITQDKIDGYNIIRNILRYKISTDKIVYKDSKSYFAIGVGNASYWWGCRLAFGNYKKSIYFPTDDYKSQERVGIETLDDIFKYADRLEQVFDMANTAYEKHKSKHQKS